MLLESRANADIVVSEPQNHTAANREYPPSRCQCCDNTTNTPRTFTIKTLTGNVLKNKGDSMILCRRYAPIQNPLKEK